jgi:hypothetical protein
MPVWQRISSSSKDFDELLGSKWAFDQIDGHSRGRMFITLPELDLPTHQPKGPPQMPNVRIAEGFGHL